MDVLRYATAAAMLLAAVPASSSAEDEVDLALVLAVDCSFSVDSGEFKLQMEGLGQAFQRADVKAAIRNGNHRRIAVSVVEWSDNINQKTVVPWTILARDADADQFGEKLKTTKRELAEGGTSISSALLYAAHALAEAPATARRVIDLSSDGRNNIGIPVASVRDGIVGAGITINALAILNEWPTLDVYFKNNVVGGDGHFVMPANDYKAYGDAITRKLIQEITGPGIS
jgi:hypothetical protein